MWRVVKEFKFEEIAPAWAKSHLQVPTTVLIKDRLRTYYATRDQNGRSQLMHFDTPAEDPTNIIAKSDKPLVRTGNPGTFDQDGVMVSSVVPMGDEIFIYYTGWRMTIGVPYITDSGLLVGSASRNNFKRLSHGPVLGINSREPYFTNTPYVYKIGENYGMIYGSGKGWILDNDRYEPIYQLRITTSSDGIVWGNPVSDLNLHSKLDNCTVRASLLPGTKSRYFYSEREATNFRGNNGSYKIKEFNFDENGNINTLGEIKFEFPKEIEAQNMLAYPNCVSENTNLMYFNGSNFGKKSIFLAVEEK